MSEEKRGDLERDEVERRLADAARHFEISHDMICTLTFGGRIDRLNPAFTNVLGWAVEDLGPAALIELIHPDERGPLLELMRGMLSSGEGEGTNRFKTKDGGWRWIEWAAVLDHSSQRVFAAGRDITERRRLEEENAERQRRLLTLTNTAPVGIYEIDADGDCTFVNDYFCSLPRDRARRGARQGVAGADPPARPRIGHRRLAGGRGRGGGSSTASTATAGPTAASSGSSGAP